MCAATGTWAGAGREKEPGLFSVRRNLSLPHSAALPTTQHLAAAHLPPHHGGGGFLLWPLLSSDSSSCASQPGSGEGMRPGVVVSPGPLSRCSRGGGRGWSQGGRQGKAHFWVPRATRGFASEVDSRALPVSCRSGRCDLVSTLEAWGALALTPPQPPTRAKEQRRQRLGPRSLERQMPFFPPGHCHQHPVTSDRHSRPLLLDCHSSLGTWILCQASPVFILPLTHRI